jgi:EAL domain-containing protein (putative c-di-GMP-specific phosphodiesterase class I)
MDTQTNPVHPLATIFSDVIGHKGIERVLRTVRKHLGMDVAFISHFQGSQRLFEAVDADGAAPIKAGMVMPLQEGYCLKVIEGHLPQLILDAGVHPVASQIPATASIPIGSHLSVPIELEDGSIYGTLCCFSFVPDVTLGERDLKMMKAFSEVIAERVDELSTESRLREMKANNIRKAMHTDQPRMVYQPVFNLRTGALEGAESLSRFHGHPNPPPDEWFKSAHEAGVGTELELHTVIKAALALERLPHPTYLAVNSSPELLISGKLLFSLAGVDLSRIVIEITEHAIVADYEILAAALAPLREKGARVAIDDAGAGYASMRHILRLKPDIIKLDISLTRDIDSDSSRKALARGLISFAREIGAKITAEGVETKAELDALKGLGADNVQGFYLSKPMPIEDVLKSAGTFEGDRL